MRSVRLSVLLLLLGAGHANSEVIVCDEPRGQRADEAGVFAADSFTSVYPMFVREAGSVTVRVHFGSSKLYGEVKPDKWSEAVALESSATRLRAIERAGPDLWLYTIDLASQIGFFSRHGSHPLGGGFVAAYRSTCRVQP